MPLRSWPQNYQTKGFSIENLNKRMSFPTLNVRCQLQFRAQVGEMNVSQLKK